MLPRFAYNTFSLQIELWDNSDDYTGDVAQGLIFRARDNDHFYSMLIDPRKGQYTVRKLDGPDKLDLMGYVGISLFGRTMSWTREPATCDKNRCAPPKAG